ncbi:cell division ATP-binding protein FtsE [Clostridium sp. D2Q-11]|uniref:Cell division ATP-binding protein FtsE n=1 Tax=Anaeromonas frigoriresistens TaxID=2683708 RepID=A0A942UVY7_9FIRM|nr:cell division ATP-binding protein FtsE [Anaeromonas frigoriresistens]MBS4537421.1 cell division ATP-binding protein FtsE [Anaeromonas frigoriresistens]
MIRLQNVVKEYKNGVKALNDVNIHIEKGDFVFLVGSSGAGKSTLIKLLMKEIDPDKGKLYLANKDITKVTNRSIPEIRRLIGMVFQDFRLLQNKTVYENIAFAMEIIGQSAKEIRRQVPKVLNLVGLSHKADSFPNQLSGGEQQRVSIARAIVNNPTVLIADEPTGNLDPDTAWEIMNVLKDINRRGTTVLMATHAKDIVDVMQKRVIALSEGKVTRDDRKGVYGYEF